MNRLSLRLLVLIFLALGWQILPGSAHAATSNVSCSAIITPVSFGAVDPNVTGTVKAVGGVQFTCTNTAFLVTEDVTLCVGIGQGAGTSITPTRQMIGPAGSTLQFQLYTGNAVGSPVWGNVPSTSNPAPLPLQFSIAGAFLVNGTYTSPTYPIYGSLTTPQSGLASGSYINDLNGTLAYAAGDQPIFGTSYPATCNGGTSKTFSLPVTATVASQCTVGTVPALILGAAGGVAAGTANITGSTTIGVTCTTGTAYNVGLAPSSNSLTGAGLMTGTGTNTDKVPYQLYQTAGGTTVWGNTATSSVVGNGKAGVGSGTNQSLTVYAIAPGSNFKPDTYSDTVTINVNY